MITCIAPQVWIADDEPCTKKTLDATWAVVHACKSCHRKAVGYTERSAPKNHPEYLMAERPNALYLNLIDVVGFIAPELINRALDFISANVIAGRQVCIHCDLGESRSASIGLLYLVRYTNRLSTNTLRQAIDDYRYLYQPFNPGAGMVDYLKHHWTEKE